MAASILFELLRFPLAIEPGFAERMRPVLTQLIQQRDVDMAPHAAVYADKLQAHLRTSDQLVGPQRDPYTGRDLGFTQAYADGSIALIPLQGTVMKSDYCGALGTKSISAYMAQAAANPTIKGVILYVDSPGGAALGTNEASTLIRDLRSQKPMVTFVDGMMASAAMWIGSSTHWAVANQNDFNIIGSIGTYMQMEDWTGVAGAPRLVTVKATASYEKNTIYEDAINGNPQPLLDQLINPLNDNFLAGMTKNRYGRRLNKDKTFHGATFGAEDAMKYGLIDQIGTLDTAIKKVQELSKSKSA